MDVNGHSRTFAMITVSENPSIRRDLSTIVKRLVGGQGKRISVDKIVEKNIVLRRRCRYGALLNTYFALFGNGVVKVRLGFQMILYMVMFTHNRVRLQCRRVHSCRGRRPSPPRLAHRDRRFWSPALLIFLPSLGPNNVVLTDYSVTLTLTLLQSS